MVMKTSKLVRAIYKDDTETAKQERLTQQIVLELARRDRVRKYPTITAENFTAANEYQEKRIKFHQGQQLMKSSMVAAAKLEIEVEILNDRVKVLEEALRWIRENSAGSVSYRAREGLERSACMAALNKPEKHTK